jgi:molecular chaperone DnaJ
MKDYYLILKVSRDATKEDIRKAHRRLVTRYHPDRSEEPDVEKFREIQEAYEVLSDEERRRAYNHKLEAYEERLRRPQRSAQRRPTVSLFEDFGTIFPSVGEILDHIGRNFFGPLRKVEPVRGLDVEVVLEPEEALSGVVFPLRVPSYETCPWCRGSGGDFPFSCLRCEGDGRILSQKEITVTIPARVRDGTVLRYPLDSLGIRNLWLTITVRTRL